MKENIRTGISWKLSSEISSYFALCLTAGTVKVAFESFLLLYAPAGQEELQGLTEHAVIWIVAFGGLYTAVLFGGALLERPAAATAAMVLLAAVTGITMSDLVPQAARTQEVENGLTDLMLALTGAELPGLVQPSFLFSIGAQAAAAFVLLLLHRLISSYAWTQALYMLAADVSLILLSVRGMEIGKVTAVLMVLLSVLSVRRLSDAHYLRWMGQLCVLCAVCLCIPFSSRPIDWSVLWRIGARIQDGVESVVADTGYLLSGLGSGNGYESGYSGLGIAGGAFMPASREELYLEGGKTRGPVYLKGAMHGDLPDTGTDMTGIQAMELQGRWLLDYLSALYRYGVTREEARLFGYAREYKIEFGYLRTDDIIYPQHLLRLSLDREALSADGSHFGRVRGKGTNYSATFMEIDYGSPYLEDIMRRQYEPAAYPAYDVLRDFARMTYDLQLNLYVTEAEYNQWTNRGQDLQEIPDGIYYDPGDPSQRVRELALEITEGIGTEYDKCRAIEAFLRQYTYNRNAETGDHLTEDFLFLTKEGFCVHYTAAMVTLLRLNGIAARCAEGYVCPSPGRTGEPYAVTGNRAHAWPEAYIRGFGWVPFEPTPSRTTSLASTWNMYLPGEAPLPAADTTAAAKAIPEGQTVLQPDAEEGTDTGEGYHAVQILLSILRTIVIAAAALLTYFAVSLTAMYITRRRRFSESDGKSQMTILMEDIRWMILCQAKIRGSDTKNALAAGDYPDLLPRQEDLLLTSEGSKAQRTTPWLNDGQEIRPLAVHVFDIWNAIRFGGRNVLASDLAEARTLHLMLRRIMDLPESGEKRGGRWFRRLYRRVELLLHLKACF